MNDKAFVDTNLLIYAISSDAGKAQKVETLLRRPFDFLISTQVINEFVQTCYRKNLLPPAEIRRSVDDFLLFFELATIEKSTILTGLDLKERYRFSWFDSLIVAASIENGCTVLFSEDLQDGLIVDAKLTIQNPLLP